MRLITEVSEDIEMIEEETLDEARNPVKRRYIKGIFAQAEVPNRNKRIYPLKTLSEKVEKYNNDYVQRNRAYGELGHPATPIVNGDRVCMRIVELKQEGNDFYGKAQISSTPMGKIVEGLIIDGGRLGVSTRGMGTLKPRRDGVNEVQGDYILAAVDVVTDPSAPSAFVDGVMEGVNWTQTLEGAWIPEYLDKTREKIKKTPKGGLMEAKLRAFEDFISRF